MRPSATLLTTLHSGLRGEKPLTTCLSCGTEKKEIVCVGTDRKMKYPWQLPLRLGWYILVIIYRKCNWKSTPNAWQHNPFISS